MTTPTAFPGTVTDYHSFVCHDFVVNGCDCHVVEPVAALPGKPWVWRAMFWDAFPGADIELLKRGYHLAYIEVGNTFGCPDALAHWDPFYDLLVNQYGFSPKPALEGLSRGGLYIYRWAAVNTDKVGCLYGDAPVCDFKSWPGGKGSGPGGASDWAKLQDDYHFASEAEALSFTGNPVDILEPIAKAGIPIIHVCGDIDEVVPMAENTDIMRERYIKLGGTFVSIVKREIGHHPHGAADTTPVVNFIMAHAPGSAPNAAAIAAAPKAGDVIVIPAPAA
ncbi:MAG TPA: hypothetical protein VGK19_04710 [Capsulimonadaceae bacterium]|jgi:hypothetical protein